MPDQQTPPWWRKNINLIRQQPKDILAITIAALLILAPLAVNPAKYFIEEYWEKTNYNGPWQSDLLSWLTFAVLLGQLWIFRGQRSLMDKQANIASRQADISERQLLIQSPFFIYDIHSLAIKLDSADPGTVESYKIHLIWRNSGKDIATNVTYWIGRMVQVRAGDDAEWRKAVGDKFVDTIFRARGLEGRMSVAPDGTVETDQILLTPDILGALYRKEIRLLVWCVLAYGSRIQPPGWFAEVAIYLEFVLERDPVTYRPVAGDAQTRPFRVAIIGYRYREDKDDRAQTA